MEILVIINKIPSFQISINQNTTIGSIKSSLANNIENYEEYSKQFFLNNQYETKIFDTDKYDNVKMNTVWDKLNKPSISFSQDNKSRFDILPKDMLFKLALELPLPDLISFCSNQRINQLVCSQKDIWLVKLEKDFPNHKALDSDPRENYEKLYGLTEIRKKLGLKQNIYELYDLQELNLQYRKIEEIPKEIGVLSNLRALLLNDNQIKEIPKEIGKLTNLETLFLDNNQIKEIPKEIGQLNNLKHLTLGYNQIRKIPKEIKNLDNLQILKLSGNLIENIPKEIGSLTNLNWLELQFNQIRDIPEEIGNLNNLERLLLAKNQIKVIPESINNANNLIVLDLRQNNIKRRPKGISKKIKILLGT